MTQIQKSKPTCSLSYVNPKDKILHMFEHEMKLKPWKC